MTAQSSVKQSALSFFTNIATYVVTAIFIAIFTLISFLLRYFIDFTKLFSNTTIFYIWISVNILAIFFAIFGICYILITREPKEFISDYRTIDRTDKIYRKVEIDGTIFFNCYTAHPNIHGNQPEESIFSRYLYIRGPYCNKCSSLLIPKINPITKKCKYYYCSICEKNISLDKKYKGNFERKIRNLALVEFKKIF